MSFREKIHRVSLVTLPMAFGSHPPAEPGRIGTQLYLYRRGL